MANGQKIWEHLWRANYKLNVAEPIVVGDRVFITSTYATNDILLQIEGNNASVVWQNGNLQNQLNSSVLVDGALYGVAGLVGPTPNASLRCIDWQTGAIKWDYPDLGGGAIMVAGGKIIALSDKGELFVGAVSPSGFTPISRLQVLGGRCWTVPVLANGHIYCRNAKGDLVCLNVR
jgi:outer membrane protein assembly factor BamB